MPWIWKKAKKAYRYGNRASLAVQRAVYGTSDYGSNMVRRGITRPFRYADIAYRNRGGGYPYPRLGFGWKSGPVPYRGSQADKDARYWRAKFRKVVREGIFNERRTKRRLPPTRERGY